MFALARAGTQRRRGHHGNRLKEERDVGPKGIRRLAPGNHFIVEPADEVGGHQGGAEGHEEPEPARAPGVAEASPEHHDNREEP